jgi:uncharacterized alpha-E superfamily protein
MQLLGATLVPPHPVVGAAADPPPDAEAPRPHAAVVERERAHVQRLWEMLLDSADSLMTYRNRYLGALEAAPLIDLLVIDETNPRSIGYQLAALADHVAHLPRDASSPVLSGEQRAVMTATSLLRLADVHALAATDADGGRGQLGGLLGRLDASLRACSESVTHRYLVHAAPRRRLGEGLESPIPAE